MGIKEIDRQRYKGKDVRKKEGEGEKERARRREKESQRQRHIGSQRFWEGGIYYVSVEHKNTYLMVFSPGFLLFGISC